MAHNSVSSDRLLVSTGLAAGALVGVVESVYAFALGSGLAGIGPIALFAIQVIAWSTAAAVPLVLVAHFANRFLGTRWHAISHALRNPDTDRRAAAWIAVLGVALALYALVLFVLAEHLIVGKRSRGASLGTFVIAAATTLLIMAAIAVAAARHLVRRFSISPRPLSPPRVVLAFAAVGALHIALVSIWLTTSLEVGYGIDLRVVVIPVTFATAWAMFYRLPLFSSWGLRRSLPAKVRLALLVTATTAVATGLFALGQRADADAALVSRSFIPRIMVAILHPPNETPLGESRAEAPGQRASQEGSEALSSGTAAVAPIVSAPPTPPAPSMSVPRPNIVLITIDTLRADHLGVYGYGRSTSPEIDRFAQNAVVFSRAYASAPNTPRSIPSLLTSRYPSQIPWRSSANYPPLPKGVRTIAEDLEAAGYRNHAILTHWYFKRERGLARGFHVWDTSLVDDEIETGREKSAPRVTERARRLLVRAKDAKKPFFLWVHYFEPHHFYVLHKGVPTFGTAMIDKYDHEIRFVDREVGRFLQHVEALGLASTTAIVLTSDHGEAFGEHGKYWHGHALYDEQLRVPLIVRLASPRPAPYQSDAIASLVDLRPTIAEIGGAKLIGPAAGKSLVAAVRGEPPEERTIFAEILPQPNYTAHLRMTLRGRWKLIEDVRMRSVELYDLHSDRREQRNEATRARAMLDELRSTSAILNGTHP